jgi:tRNA(fMet)-specific endonuclease VapC
VSQLLDADWTISYLNGRPDAIALVTRLASHGVALSAVTCGEVFEGLLSEGAPRRRDEFELFIQRFAVIGVDGEIARRYAEVRADLRPRGQLIPDNDIWIAATALTHDLTLVTRDGHFARVPELKLG